MTMTLQHKNKTMLIVGFFMVAAFVVLISIIPMKLSKLGQEFGTTPSLYYFEDKASRLDLDSALLLADNEWLEMQNTSLGNSTSTFWIKTYLPPNNSAQKQWLLINYALLDLVQLWFLSSPETGSQAHAAYLTGDTFPYDYRAIDFEKFLFPVPQEKAGVYVILKVESAGTLNLPIQVWQDEPFIEYNNMQQLYFGGFFGFMLAMALVNLFIYSSNYKPIFLYYTGYLMSMALIIVSYQGFSFRYLWPDFLWLQAYTSPIFVSFLMIFMVSLSCQLLNIKQHYPIVYRLLKYARLGFVCILILCTFLPYQVVIALALLLLAMTIILVAGIGIVMATKKDTVAQFFCAAWGILLWTGLTIVLEQFSVIHLPIDSSYLLIVGSVTESILLTFALAVSFNLQMKEAEAARLTAQKNESSSIYAQNQLVKQQQQNEKDLQYSIAQRTFELGVAVKELAEKSSELEKLSAVDPLTGFNNRRFFDRSLLAYVRRSKREQRPLGIAILDIDHFKTINDNYGHACGDQCLRVFSQILKDCVGQENKLICRYGGEEFVLILPNKDVDALKKVVEKIRLAVEDKKIMSEGKVLRMTVSGGATSRLIANEDELMLLIPFVDKLLYQAKEQGRNRMIVEAY